jgi:hypothetical protein
VPLAGLVLAAVLFCVALLSVALLGASFVPSEVLTSRLFGAAGEVRNGAFTQDLVAHLGERLRLSAAVLVVLVAGLTVTRSASEELIADGLRLGWVRAWTSPMSLLGVGAPTLLAVALRIPFLSQPMRYDEALTFNEFASRPLYYGLSFYPDPNNHLLNTLLMHGVFGVFGNQPWILRLPAFVAGVLLVPATYGLARPLFGPRAAILSATLVAVSSYLVEYSTNGRGYTLQALSFVVLLALAILAVRLDSPKALLLAAIVSALGAYAVPTMLYGVAIAGVWLAVSVRRALPTRIRPVHLVAAGLLVGLAVAVLYLPVLVISGPDKLWANRFVVPLDGAELAAQLPRSLASTFALWNRDVPLALAALLVVGFVLGSLRARLGLMSVGICLVLVLVQRVAPFERVWLFLLPLYFTIASGGLARFVDGRLLAIAFGALVGFFTLTSGSIAASVETGVFPDAEAVTRSLVPRLAADDAVITMLPASLPELQYYFPKYGLPIEALVRAPEAARRVWVITAPGAQPEVVGGRDPAEVERFGGSTLFEVSR